MKDTQIKIVKVGMGHHAHVVCKINGKEARMILDTGASSTVLCKTAVDQYADAEQLQRGQGSVSFGSSDLKTETIYSDIEIAGRKFVGHNFMVLDLSNVNEAYVDMFGNKSRNVVGIIGADLLLQGQAVISFYTQEIFMKDEKRG